MKYLFTLFILWQTGVIAAQTPIHAISAPTTRECELQCDARYPEIRDNAKYIECYQHCAKHVNRKNPVTSFNHSNSGAQKINEIR
ncbi:MAG: hypothetical protein KIT27_09140 [Legionellales bacterium]|nr:hypothetical protein [Legionellales bacterium]